MSTNHMTRNTDLAEHGVMAAEKYLEIRGYELVEHKYSCDTGEIDIIAKHEGTLVFIEVKTRRYTNTGMPDEAISIAKRRKFENIAACYISERDDIDCCDVRFDIIAIMASNTGKALLRHHINALS